MDFFLFDIFGVAKSNNERFSKVKSKKLLSVCNIIFACFVK